MLKCDIYEFGDFIMSTAQLVYQAIEKIPNGDPFTTESLKSLGSWESVRKTLSRLTKSGKLIRIEKGIYAKYETYNGIKFIRTHAPLIKCIEQVSHETVVKAGTMAVNQLGISTQCQMKEAYYWTGRKKVVQFGNYKINLHHINRKYANKSHPILELILSAAYSLGKEQFTINALKQVESKLGVETLLEMKHYLHQMPTWVMVVLNKYYETLS
ncbi:MAG: hypothetical protein K0R14_180 [Burkholderiales bacterium]|jgi:hypothetical protein|nr:hypothetical protein [Burkholderiales bacterium]